MYFSTSSIAFSLAVDSFTSTKFIPAFTIEFTIVEKFLWYLVMTTLIYWIQIIHIPTLLSWVYESGYSFSSVFVSVGSVLFWWCGIIYFTIPDYGELIAYNSKHSLNRDMMNENQH